MSTLFFWVPDAAPEGLQIRCSIFRRKREQRPSHVLSWNTGFYSSPLTTRLPCVLQIRAGIMEFTCNSALSAVYWTQFLKAPWDVRHTDDDFATRVSKYASSVAHLRDFTAIRLGRYSRRSFAAAIGFLTSDRWFTREDLLLARFYERLWPAPKPAWCVASPW